MNLLMLIVIKLKLFVIPTIGGIFCALFGTIDIMENFSFSRNDNSPVIIN